MKIKKLWLMVLTMVFAVMLSTSAYCAKNSGKCGNNLTWTLTDDGTLTISGTGAMEDFVANDPEAPFYQNKSGIKTVIIKDGVTSIGTNAFSNCSYLTSVEIPSSVTSIGNMAFNFCSGLTSVEIPSSVESIGVSAFFFCSGLTSVENLSSASIGVSAFNMCNNIKTYYYKEGAEDISSYGAKNINKKVIIPDNTSYIYTDNLDGTIAGGVVTFDVKVDTTNFVGGEGTPYLDEVRVIINDTDTDYKLNECYEADNYIIFPVQINVNSASITSLAIRAEVYAKPNKNPEGDTTYYASSVSKVA